MIARGIDTDNYDGPVSVDVFRDLFDNFGVRANVVGCQVGLDNANYTEIQRDNSRAAGLIVDHHYDFLYWDARGSGDLERMKRAAGFGLPVFMDEETEGGFLVGGSAWSAAQVVDRIGRARDVLISEGQWGGHYTNPGWWQRYTANSQAFAGDPLWLATWPYGNGVLPPLDYLPDFAPGTPNLGGMLIVAQQYSDVCYRGYPFDLDAFVIPDPAPAPPTPPTPPYLTRFERVDHFSDGSSYVVTGAYDAPPWALA